MKRPARLVPVGIAYFAFGAAIAWALMSFPLPEDVEVELYLLGTRIDHGKSMRPQAASIVRRYIASELKLNDGRAFETVIVPRQVGASVDLGRLERTIKTILSNRGDIARYLKMHRSVESARIDLILPVKFDYQDIQDFLLNLKYGYDRKAMNARFDMEKRSIVPHEEGRRLLLDDTIARMEIALSEGKRALPMAVNVSEPARRTGELENVDIEKVLGWYETPYCQMKKCWDRNHNLELGGKLLDGTIVWPGETFDFNETLGDRTEARGFRPAPTIEQGSLTLSPGGGTCQTASTLYAAAFFAGMELVQRRPHTRPSGYILLGLDATVTYPHINLAFRNPFDFPVVIHYKVGGGKMRVEILGKEKRRSVHFIRRITQRLPHDEKAVEEPQWPRGVSVVTQLGIDGFRVRRYRVVWEGSHMEREMTESYYPPTTRVVHVGMNASMEARGFDPPLEPDDHVPYQADPRIRFYLDEKNEFKKIVAGW